MQNMLPHGLEGSGGRGGGHMHACDFAYLEYFWKNIKEVGDNSYLPQKGSGRLGPQWKRDLFFYHIFLYSLSIL